MKKIYLISGLCMLLVGFVADAQTVLVNPATVGGFESGTTLVANGWQSNTGSTNRWTVGTGATAGFSGTRAAYVSNNPGAATPPHTYTVGTASVGHFWRDITFPAGETDIRLTFTWIGRGEGGATIYDRMRVWLVPTTYTPASGTGITVAAGRIQLGLTDYLNQATWVNTGILTIPNTYAGTSARLVFEWINDTSLGTQPPAGVDNISVTSQIPPVPANNECVAAVGLTVNASGTCGVSTSGTTVAATQSQVGCTGNADDDVWYSFVATGTTHGVTVTPGTLNNAVFEVFSGACGALTSLGCINNTAAGNVETSTFTGLTPAVTYYVRVYSNGNAAQQGTFSICVTTPIANDECSGAINIPVNASCSYSTYNNIGATGSPIAAPGCASYNGGDVWFTATVPASGALSVTLQAGGITDSGMAIYTGSCAGLTLYQCNDDAVGLMSAVTASGLTPGSTVYIRVWEYGGDTFGTFGICAVSITPIANDNCSGAVSLTVNPTNACTVSTSGTTAGATQSQSGCAGNADDDVWYSFVATATSHVVRVTPTTLSDAVIQVFSGACGSLVSLDCEDSTVGLNEEASTLTGLTIGATYIVRVYSWGTGSGSFSVCVTTPTISPPCSPGPGTGTTTLGCPSVVSGGLGLSGADPAPLNCLGTNCTDLEATYLQLGQPTTYTFEQIAYNPPYQFDCLDNPVSVNVDDVWSPLVTLPFNFCFYGNNYNQVLISSNGVITFDTTTYAPGGYSTWSFSNTLPSNALFLNSIFGVYHDIDPSLGGQVGWELITLNTGCRALVAAWHDIPMFSCTSVLYTGMIVLYENTNVIEVYVEEKNTCSGWNGGNALIGVQNGNGTAAVAPPGRNSVTADWNGTPGGEAWRFTPAGTSITTIRWFEGPTATGPVIGTSDILNVCPPTTTTYTAQVSYALCGGATLTEEESVTVTVSPSKVWNGSVDDNWNVANNWTPSGVPTSSDCVIVPNVTNDCYVQGASFDAFAYSVNVQNGGLLQVNSANNLTVTNLVNVNAAGTFNIMNSGSLIQTMNVPNIGSMNMERITPAIDEFDYIYWNSPVTQASNFTLGMLSPDTQVDKYYSWSPCCGGLGGSGIWAQESAASVMTPTKGYIVRGPNSFISSAPYTANFIGTPNNGQIVAPISYGTALPENDKWNLIGNPYPSAVSASAFVSSLNNSTILDGTLYFWAHNIPPAMIADPFYGDYVYNYSGNDYASWNTTGGVAATSGGAIPNGRISAGQSFFIKSLAVPGSAIFENSMRVPDWNNQFFRPNAEKVSSGPLLADDLERHRIWLNLRTDSGLFNQTLVGYVQGATMARDRDFDGETLSDGSASLYSLIEGHDLGLVIQGRPLPFSADDRVPLGYSSTTAGTFSIRLSEFDGLFANQDIFLEDKELEIIHNLKEAPYFFAAVPGVHNSRFILRYTDGTSLGTSNDMISGVAAYLHNQQLNVRAQNEIVQIQLFDVAGKLLQTTDEIYSGEYQMPFNYPNGVYLAKIRTTDGALVTRKIMH